MEESSKNFTPQESLEIIGRFIMNYKKNFKESSFYFLLWGWVVLLASVSHFLVLMVLLNMKEYGKIGIFSMVNWISFTVAGIVIQSFHFKRTHDQKVTRSHIDSFIRSLWQVTAIAIVMIIFLCMKTQNYYPSPFILTVVGLSTLVTGVTIKFRPLILGGVVFFVLAVIGSFINNEYQLLINALAITLGYLVPGYMLRSSKTE
jgi:hypothetical protein